MTAVLTKTPDEANMRSATKHCAPRRAPSKRQTTAHPVPNVPPSAAPNSQQAITDAEPNVTPLAASNSDETTSAPSPSTVASRRSNLPTDQTCCVPYSAGVGGDQDTQQATPLTVTNTPLPAGADPDSSIPSLEAQTHMARGMLLFDPLLATLAGGLDDAENTRNAQANRVRQLTTGTKDDGSGRAVVPDKDGEERGFGLTPDHPAVAALIAQVESLDTLTKGMTKALEKQLKTHPLWPWIQQQKGLGPKTVARLLYAIRDPYWNDLYDRPRTLPELWAFCGVSGPGKHRRRGQVVNWNTEARKRVWIITGPIIRGDGPYRAVYDQARVKYADKLHTEACAQCGSKGKPAEAGTPWRDGHKHAGAVRIVMREILRDLWTESKRIYETEEK